MIAEFTLNKQNIKFMGKMVFLHWKIKEESFLHCTTRLYSQCIMKQSLWLKSIILAIWEAEIGRVMVRGQAGEIVTKSPSQLMAEVSGAHLSFQLTREVQIGGLRLVQASLGLGKDSVSR
jgi:hypothetical protein